MSRLDRATTVFSPDGKLLQVEYAQEVVKRGSPAVGVRGQNIVVLAVERREIPQLQVERTEKKIVALDSHVALAFAGLRADARVVISRAQIECQSYSLMLEDVVTTEYIARFIAELQQTYTQVHGSRPFGISCLVGGFDYDGYPHLFQTEPSGTYYEWKACSTGRGEKETREFLEKNYTSQEVATDYGTIRLALRALLVAAKSGPVNVDVVTLKRGVPTKYLDQVAIKAYTDQICKEFKNTMNYKKL